MKKFKIFIVMILCVSLLAFAGCGEDNNNGIDQGTTETEQNTDNGDNGDNSTMEDLGEDVDDTVDDLEDDAQRSTTGGESRDTNGDSSAKSQND